MLHEINKSGNVSIYSIIKQLSNSTSKEDVLIDIPVTTAVVKRDMAKIVPHIWELGGKDPKKSIAIIVGDKKGQKVRDFVIHVPDMKPNGKHALVPVEVGYKVAIGKKEDGMTHVYLFEIQSFQSGDKYGFSKDKMKMFAVATLKNIGAFTASWNFPDGIRTFPEEYTDIVEACLAKMDIEKCNMSTYTERWSCLSMGHKKYVQMFVDPVMSQEKITVQEVGTDELKHSLEEYCIGSNNKPYRPFSVQCSISEDGCLIMDYYPLSVPVMYRGKDNRKKKGQLKERVQVVGDVHHLKIKDANEFMRIPHIHRNGWNNYEKLIEDVKASEIKNSRPIIFGIVFKGYIQ